MHLCIHGNNAAHGLEWMHATKVMLLHDLHFAFFFSSLRSFCCCCCWCCWWWWCCCCCNLLSFLFWRNKEFKIKKKKNEVSTLSNQSAFSFLNINRARIHLPTYRNTFSSLFTQTIFHLLCTSFRLSFLSCLLYLVLLLNAWLQKMSLTHCISSWKWVNKCDEWMVGCKRAR